VENPASNQLISRDILCIEEELKMLPNFTDRQWGDLCREKLEKYLENEWGRYESLRYPFLPFVLKFSNGREVCSFYASLRGEFNERWFFGVCQPIAFSPKVRRPLFVLTLSKRGRLPSKNATHTWFFLFHLLKS
jgi:hypothetical protein